MKPTDNPDIKKELLETVNKITEEYGSIHKAHCPLNDENSDYPCDCVVRFMVKEVVETVSALFEAEILRRVCGEIGGIKKSTFCTCHQMPHHLICPATKGSVEECQNEILDKLLSRFNMLNLNQEKL